MKILTVKGQQILLDDADFDRLKDLPWMVSQGYAFRCEKRNGKTLNFRLAHAIIGFPPKRMVTDHIDGNGLNNQRSNLRFCTYQQNMMNRKVGKNNKTGLKGVAIRPGVHTVRYEATIKINRKTIRLGTFRTPLEAHAAYQKKAQELFGEYHRPSPILKP